MWVLHRAVLHSLARDWCRLVSRLPSLSHKSQNNFQSPMGKSRHQLCFKQCMNDYILHGISLCYLGRTLHSRSQRCRGSYCCCCFPSPHNCRSLEIAKLDYHGICKRNLSFLTIIKVSTFVIQWWTNDLADRSPFVPLLITARVQSHASKNRGNQQEKGDGEEALNLKENGLEMPDRNMKL